MLLQGDDAYAAQQGPSQDSHGSEDVSSLSEVPTSRNDDRALGVSLPAQLHLDARAMLDMRQILFSQTQNLDREPRVRPSASQLPVTASLWL